eukprot:jgi/Mesvir1/7130/Mv26524-RA.1
MSPYVPQLPTCRQVMSQSTRLRSHLVCLRLPSCSQEPEIRPMQERLDSRASPSLLGASQAGPRAAHAVDAANVANVGTAAASAGTRTPAPQTNFVWLPDRDKYHLYRDCSAVQRMTSTPTVSPTRPAGKELCRICRGLAAQRGGNSRADSQNMTQQVSAHAADDLRPYHGPACYIWRPSSTVYHRYPECRAVGQMTFKPLVTSNPPAKRNLCKLCTEIMQTGRIVPHVPTPEAIATRVAVRAGCIIPAPPEPLPYYISLHDKRVFHRYKECAAVSQMKRSPMLSRVRPLNKEQCTFCNEIDEVRRSWVY